MINKKDQISFIRNFLACDGIDFFLGSGASLLAGIPSGQNLVWEFKKEIYCSENNVSRELFKDLQSERNRRKLQNYFDSLDGFPSISSKMNTLFTLRNVMTILLQETLLYRNLLQMSNLQGDIFVLLIYLSTIR